MKCLFCASEKHKSGNCDKYGTDEWKEIAEENGYCRFCCIKSNNSLKEEKTKSDKSSIKSYYSTENHTLFCRERVAAFKLFLPKLDESLLPRFLDMFELDEKYSMALSTPTAPNFLLLKPIKIMNSFNYKESEKYIDVTLLNNSVTISNFDIDKDKELSDAITSKTLICLSKAIIIYDSKLSSQFFLQFLSKYTTELRLTDSSFNPNISFKEIIKNAPNLESISIYDFSTNIKIDNSWVENLLEYKTGKKLEYLNIKLNAVEEFDVEKLVEFVKTKCIKDVNISLQYDQALLDSDDDGAEEWKKLDQLGQKLLKYFDDYFDIDHDVSTNHSSLRIGIDGVDGYQTFSLAKAWETETASKPQT